MESYVSISVSPPHIVECVYRRISGELRRFGIEPRVEGNVIKIPKSGPVEEAVWKVVKTTPAAVYLSIDFK